MIDFPFDSAWAGAGDGKTRHFHARAGGNERCEQRRSEARYTMAQCENCSAANRNNAHKNSDSGAIYRRDDKTTS
ncbi:hypothetical protein G3N59_10310 [Paraburkholderia sp. Ac-20340]|uniref:hypothetical protein n=1 Tax=Paraburkholderia sp. Ac-20340 TaxID=2703888 RepID=UPI0019812A53|nr:hypothetical protein [Paraburkholderia sp. Ac-20340]MBN3853772.1 hypothetical protein [Paraburkholderia sp. Ac-20340]